MIQCKYNLSSLCEKHGPSVWAQRPSSGIFKRFEAKDPQFLPMMTTSKKSGSTKKTSSTKARTKAPPQQQKHAASKKAATMKGSQASNTSQPTLRRTMVEDVDDKEVTSVGGTLDCDGDAMMEEVNDMGVDDIVLTDAETEEESEESELSEPSVFMLVT